VIDTETLFLPATEQARLIREKELSPVELVTAYLERIDRLNPQINAYVHVAADSALAGAKEAENSAGPDSPPFHGVPIPIKDLDEVAGMPTTYGSRAFADNVSEQDAAIVTRLKGAGFVMLGKTNASEFGTLPLAESDLHEPCRNPWDPTRTSGGSSGGAAAAVASGMAPVAQGNDGGGSIRIPAGCCGLVGIKPSRGRISWGPRLGDLGGGLATHGVIARTVGDAAAVLDVMAGRETGDPYSAPTPERPFAQEVEGDPGKLRLAVSPDGGAYADPVCEAAVRDVAGVLEGAGHEMEDATPEWADPEMLPHWQRIWGNLAAYYEVDDLSKLEPLNREFAEMAEQVTSHDYVRSVNWLAAFARRISHFWDERDILVMPTTAQPAVPVGSIRDHDDIWMQWAMAGMFTGATPYVNILGLPSISVPVHWTEESLPIGVQLVGQPNREDVLIRVAAQLERERPWADRRPSLG
jgi:amidase